ncbi:MAG TPA: ABC transporter permease subunit [Oscillatoriaceae cyanobacterium]
MRSISLIAWRELRDALHSRWLLGFGLLLALLTLAISYYGLVSAHEVGFQGFASVSASLLNLILFALPLVAMLQAIASLNADGDELAILLTQPLARGQVLLGKYLGMLASMVVTLGGGLLLGGLVVLVQAGGDALLSFLLLMLLSFVLMAAFSAIGMLLGVVWRERTRALGTALAVWFALDVLYDLVVFGVTISSPGFSLKAMLIGALLLNPIDGVRVCYLLTTGASSFVGVAGAVLAETLGSPLGLASLVGVLLLTPIATLGVAGRLFQRRDF